MNYVGVGNSTNKKDAQGNAALDFCQFLVRTGCLNQNDLPKVLIIISELQKITALTVKF
jgi:hypothetical protein